MEQIHTNYESVCFEIVVFWLLGSLKLQNILKKVMIKWQKCRDQMRKITIMIGL